MMCLLLFFFGILLGSLLSPVLSCVDKVIWSERQAEGAGGEVIGAALWCLCHLHRASPFTVSSPELPQTILEGHSLLCVVMAEESQVPSGVIEFIEHRTIQHRNGPFRPAIYIPNKKGLD